MRLEHRQQESAERRERLEICEEGGSDLTGEYEGQVDSAFWAAGGKNETSVYWKEKTVRKLLKLTIS